MEHIIWLGDFNRHHPMWDEGRNAHLFMRANLDRAQHLIDAITEIELYMALPKDLPTLCTMASSNHMRPDNVFMSNTLCNATIKCTTMPEEQPAISDHLPIVTIVDAEPVVKAEMPRPNFRVTNW